MTRALALCVALAACTSGPDEYDANELFIANSNANWWGLIRAANEYQDSPIAERATTYTTNCPVAGGVAVRGDFANGALVGGAFAVDSDFDGCNLGNPGGGGSEWHQIVDGPVHWESNGPTHAMDGFLHYRGHSGTFDCTISLRMNLNEEGTQYSGTVCDFDVQRDLGITP